MEKTELSDYLDDKYGSRFLADANDYAFDSSADPAIEEDVFGDRF